MGFFFDLGLQALGDDARLSAMDTSLSTALRSFPGVSSVTFHAEPIPARTDCPASKWGIETLHFRCVVTIAHHCTMATPRHNLTPSHLRSEYSCGAGRADASWQAEITRSANRVQVPLRDAELLRTVESYRRSIEGSAALARLRALYRPSLDDFLAAILLDIGSIEGHDDWISWAFESPKYAELHDAESLRSLARDFETIRGHRRTFANAIGARNLAALVTMAGEI